VLRVRAPLIVIVAPVVVDDLVEIDKLRTVTAKVGGGASMFATKAAVMTTTQRNLSIVAAPLLPM
jgi:chemotaxis receptor (MCP) glutamine deamidase CheD